ncbi:MAG: HlyD family efflux transporter periplasmic adaptor subunit, partial [Planctomycetota bacterium]
MFVLLLLAACGGQEVVGTATPAVAVVVQTLEERTPRNETRVAAVVEPYRTSTLGFEVSGRLEFAFDLGQDALGPQLDGAGKLLRGEDGAPLRRGDVIARIDDERYRQAVRAAELAIASTERSIEALDVEVESVLAAQLENARATVEVARADVASARESVEVARADLDLATVTVERDRVLIQSGAVAQSVLDESEASYRTATAQLAQSSSALESTLQSELSAIAGLSEAEGTIRVRRADRETLVAELEELGNELERARTDLVSCVLRAPFSGRITDKYVSKGAYVSAGQSIVQLTLQSPIKVVLTASPEQERRLILGRSVPVYRPTAVGERDGAPIAGTVFEKLNQADSGTRTFSVGLIVPNPLLEPPVAADSADVRRVFPVVPALEDPSGAPFVHVDTVFEEGGQSFALRLPDIDAAGVGALLVPELVPVVLTDQWDQVDAWTLRRLADGVPLRAGEALLVDPQPADRDGIRLGSRGYAFRSGDVVQVGLDLALPERGFWVPVEAILNRSGDTAVFVVEGTTAKQVSVRVDGASGGLRRIVSGALE